MMSASKGNRLPLLRDVESRRPLFQSRITIEEVYVESYENFSSNNAYIFGVLNYLRKVVDIIDYLVRPSAR